MLILIFLIFQLAQASEVCQSFCRKNDSLDKCIECLYEYNDDFIKQSLCSFSSTKSIFQWPLDLNKSYPAQIGLLLNSMIFNISLIIWLIRNFNEGSILELIYAIETQKSSLLDSKCLDISQFIEKCKTCNIECPQWLWPEQSCQSNKISKLCNKNCKSCLLNNSTLCETCHPGSFLYKNSCLKTCPEGTISNSNSNICEIHLKRKLFSCSAACADACTQDTPNGSCTSCSVGYYSDYYNNGLCVQYCDAGLSSSGGICTSPDSTYFDYIFPTQINPIYPSGYTSSYQALISSVSSTGSLLNNPLGPYPILSSGFYFPSTGTGYIQLPPNSASSSYIILGNHFHIALYVFPNSWSSDHCLFAKEGSNYIALSLYITSNLDLHVVYTAYDTLTMTSQQSDVVISAISAFNNWNLIELHADYTNSKLGVYINGASAGSITTSSSFFKDSDTETFSVAKSLINNQGFYGSIYEILIAYNSVSYGTSIYSYKDDCNWNYLRCGGYSNSFTDVISRCPGITEFFFYSDWTTGCQGCDPSCTYGCIQSQNCYMNTDLLCRDSIGYTPSECTACCTNCQSTTNPCSCKTNYVLKDDGSDCLPCSLKCDTCSTTHLDNCNTCSSGNYKIVNTDFCIGECPVGYTISGSNCITSVADNEMVVDFVFSGIGNEIEDRIGGFKAFMGSSWDYFPDYDDNDPIPVYQQGLYFDGNSYASLPPNPADRSAITLGNDYSIAMWIRPYDTGKNSYLFSKEGNNYISTALYISPAMQFIVQCTGYDDWSLSPTSTAIASWTTVTWKSWRYISLLMQRDRLGHLTYIVLYDNPYYLIDSSINGRFLEDFTTDNFYIGASMVQNQYFKGFIYEIQLYKAYTTTSWSPECQCDYCGGPKNTDCLRSCEYNQFYDYSDLTCKSCDSTCKYSCLKSGNCNLNVDPLCYISTGYSNSQCTQCVDGAQGAGNKCACDFKHEAVGNECQWCLYHIQDRNTISYFSEDYLSVVVEFEQPIDLAMPDTCEKLFISSSLESFGVIPDCYWNSDRTVLYVKLGENATVVEGSKITLKEGVLMTDLHACGGPKIAVNAEIKGMFSKPLIYPSPILFVPSKLYAECNDLILDASKSTGGYGRPLSYKWSFSSNPQILALSSSSSFIDTTPYIKIDRLSLSETIGNITLTVTNWLGLSASVSKLINILNSSGLYLYYDATVPFKLKTNEYKSIEVYTSSGCKAEGLEILLYSWSISESIGPYTKIDEDLLWASQTVPTTLYSPPLFFGPGVYKFSLIVTSNTNLSAFIEFNLTYSASDLIVNLPTNMTLLYPNNLTVSPEVTDPDNLPGSFAYSWTCAHNDYDCSSIIANKRNFTLNVPASSLVAGTSYVFTFSASKSTRKTTKSIIVNVAKRNLSNVTFSVIPDYVNVNQNFVIWAYPNVTDMYDSYWRVLEGYFYKRFGDSNANSFGFLANSLIPLQNYTIQYTLSNINGFSSYYLYFTTNNIPLHGQFKITPSTGIEYYTLFNFTANNYSSTDLGSLEYQFGYYLNGHEVSLNIKNESTFLYANLPFSVPLTVFVKIYDKRGWYQIYTDDVNVTENYAISSTDVINELESQLDRTVEFPLLISSINKIIQKVIWNSETSSSDLKKARDVSLNATQLLLDSIYHFDSQSFHTIVELLEGIFSGPITDQSFTINQRDLTFLILDTLLEKTKNISIYINEAAIKSIANICDRSAGLNPQTIHTDSYIIEHINQILKNLLIQASDIMSIGYSIKVDTNFIHIQSQLKNPNSIKGYESPASEYGGASVPSNMNYSVPDETIAALHILIAYDDNSGDIDSYPRGLEFLIVAITPDGKYPLSFDIYPNFFNLTIPFYAKTVNKPIKCYFYRDSEWSTDGCRFVSYDYPQVLCQCSHTSLYSAGWDLETITTVEQWYAPFYYSCSLSGLYFIIVFVLFLVDLRHKGGGLSKIYLTGVVMPFKNTEKSIENLNQISKFRYSTEEDQLFIKRHEMESNAEFIANNKEENEENNQKNIDKKIDPESVVSSTENAAFTITSNLAPELDYNDSERKRWTWHFRYHYFISFIFFSILYFSRTARFTLLMTSLVLQVFLCGIFSDFYGSGESSTVSSDFIEVSLGLWQFLFALAAPIATNILIYSLELAMSGKKRKIHSSAETITTRFLKYKGLIGYAVCIFIICFNIVATYFIAEDCDGNSSRVWLKMMIVSFAFDAFVVQGMKVLASIILGKVMKRSSFN